jgi:exopolyphosphatase/pppGpp-phosphohydrolase
MKEQRQPAVGAAVDVGSNSVHLLVAGLTGEGLNYLRDESVLLGLGDVTDRDGELPEDARAGVVGALLHYRDVARSEGAQMVTFVGTEPLRRASNAALLCDEVAHASGLALHVLSERMEGELTYLGVCGAPPLAEPVLVVDIGGGSSEVVLAVPGRPLFVASMASGSARLSIGILINDPPTANEFDRLRLAAFGLVRELPPGRPAKAVFVGGTATNLVRLAPLSRAGLEEAHGLLTSLQAAELVSRFAVSPRRARQLAAGAAMVDALFSHYGLEAAEASEASVRDGAIIAADRLGESWPARLPELVEPPST